MKGEKNMKYILVNNQILEAPYTREQYEELWPDSEITYDTWIKMFNFGADKSTDTLTDLFDEVIRISYGERMFLNKDFWEDPDFDPEQEDVYGMVWVKGEQGEPILKAVAKKIERNQWKLIKSY